MLEDNKKENIEQKSEEAPVKKKKLAVVFHSQNSVNHKNHPLGRTQFSDKAKAKVKKEAGKEEGGKSYSFEGFERYPEKAGGRGEEAGRGEAPFRKAGSGKKSQGRSGKGQGRSGEEGFGGKGESGKGKETYHLRNQTDYIRNCG